MLHQYCMASQLVSISRSSVFRCGQVCVIRQRHQTTTKEMPAAATHQRFLDIISWCQWWGQWSWAIWLRLGLRHFQERTSLPCNETMNMDSFSPFSSLRWYTLHWSSTHLDIFCSWLTWWSMVNMIISRVCGYDHNINSNNVMTHVRLSIDEWQPLMNHPVLASSLNELWSSRWHQVFRSIWLVIPFRPMRTLVNRVYGIRDDDNGDKKREKATTSRVAIAAATISVFFVSGLMHEYIALCESGIDGYGRLLIGQECFFFTLHGVLCIVEQGLWRWFKKTSHRQWTRKLLGHIWVMAIGFLTFPWFVNAFAYWEVWHANPFNTLTPFLLEHVWRKYPFLHSVCGSLL